MNEMKRYILELAKRGKRVDGRSLEEYRKPIKVEYNISKNAEGSAKVTIGNTVVLAGVKMDVGEPFPDKPDEGTLIVNAEFTPIASPTFEPGPPGEDAIELARVVDRGIRESKAIDMKDLCIEEGEKVWMVFVDIYPMNHDGNLIDAAALAAIAALKNARIPKYEDGNVLYGELTNKRLKLNRLPIATTFAKIGNFIMLDPCLKEEEVMDARFTVISSEEGLIHGLQKRGCQGLSQTEIDKMLDKAVEASAQLRKVVK